MPGAVDSGTRALPAAHEHLPALDGLRAVAVAAVTCVHLHYLSGGFLGVQVFFVLSGFLITSLLLDERDRTGRVDLRSFYLRRAARLVPAMWLSLLATASVYLVLHPGYRTVVLEGTATSLVYLSNWHAFLAEKFLPGLNYTWSLAQEEQFYLLVPPLLRRRPSWSPAVTTGMLAGFVVAMMVARLMLCVLVPGRAVATYHNPVLNLDSLLLGVAVARRLRDPGAATRARRLDRRSSAVAAAVVLCACFALGRLTGPAYGISVAVAEVTTAVVLVQCTRAESLTATVLRLPGLRWLGDRSYAVYVYQIAVIAITQRALHGLDPRAPSWVVGPPAVLLLLAVAALSTRWLEQPVRRWTRARLHEPGHVAESLAG